MKRIAVITFGCKVNQYESACILYDFGIEGYETVPFSQDADVYVINTCTVTGRTDYKSRNAIRHALEQKKRDPEIKIIVTGCYAQLNRDKINEMGEIDLIIDNNQKDMIYNYLEEKKDQFVADPFLFDHFTEQKTNKLFERARAFVKIQDGCDYYCAYCIVPLARGKPRSRSPENVLNQIRHLADNGYKEFVLTGINLGLYGRDLPESNLTLTSSSSEAATMKCFPRLTSILKEIEKINKVQRIRLSSIEPQLITQSLLEYIRQSTKLCPHLHIPLQSGSDKLLKDMNRPYSTKEFHELINEIMSLIPNVALGSDVILGLPGETETLFQETLSFVEKLPLVYLHIFPYSRRPGTKAAEMAHIPTSLVVKKRCQELAALMKQKRQQYIENLLRHKVLLGGVLERKKENYWTALSDHYIRLYYQNDKARKSDLIFAQAYRELYDGIEVVDNDRV